MADASEAPTQQAESSQPEEAPAKPIRKARVSRPERPSKEALNKDLNEVNAQIADCQKRIQEIKDAFDSKKQGRQGMENEIQEAKRKLAATIAQFRATVEQKKVLREELSSADEARKRMRDEARSLRDRLPFVKVEEIDAEIKKLEYKMAHTSLSLQEEKKTIQQIRDLGKTKEWVKEYTERMDKITADEGARGDLLAKIKDKDEFLNGLKKKEQEQKADIDALYAKSRSTSQDFPALAEERERKFAEVKLLREKVRNLHADFREKENVYWEKEREWRAQQAEDRKKAYEEREAYRKEKEARRKAWEAENFVEPFTDEIILCDQLLAYIEKLQLGAPAEGGEGQEEGGAAGKKAIEAKEGFGKMVVSKKNRGEEELDSWFSGMGGKGKKKKGAGRSARDRGERFVSHSLDAIASFGKIKVTPPTASGEFQETLVKLKEKKVEFQQKQVEEREKRAKAQEAAEVAAATAATAPAVAAKEDGEEDAKQPDSGEGETSAEGESATEHEGATKGADEGVAAGAEEATDEKADDGEVKAETKKEEEGEKQKSEEKGDEEAVVAEEPKGANAEAAEEMKADEKTEKASEAAPTANGNGGAEDLAEGEEYQVGPDGKKSKVKKIITKFESFRKPEGASEASEADGQVAAKEPEV